ncbi:MAG: putative toxin-antitoxin system toxin component, PIN family [Microcystis aeruginosa G13-07]|nr:putative toxin-antitoxin system toxin component, PIN family [Microcystis aeruginosa G13-11]NCS07945.1 putative toxin-antitoxin system toxin component, PIN family [Microcystis aeruginosa G13-07]
MNRASLFYTGRLFISSVKPRAFKPTFQVRILEISLLIRPTHHTEICRDRDDNKFLNLATSGEARYLITGDNDLLILQRYGKTEIVTAREFLKIVRR